MYEVCGTNESIGVLGVLEDFLVKCTMENILFYIGDKDQLIAVETYYETTVCDSVNNAGKGKHMTY